MAYDLRAEAGEGRDPTVGDGQHDQPTQTRQPSSGAGK